MLPFYQSTREREKAKRRDVLCEIRDLDAELEWFHNYPSIEDKEYVDRLEFRINYLEAMLEKLTTHFYGDKNDNEPLAH